MKKLDLKFIFFATFLLLLAPFLTLAQSQETTDKTLPVLPTEEDFIEMWEDGIKNDQETVIFEKIEDKKYHFKTNKFPFDGELKIFDVYLDYGYTDYLCKDKYIVAEIKLKLAGVPESRFYYEGYGINSIIKKEYRNDKNVKAYLDWYQNNCCSFYYDYQTEKWLTWEEHEKMECRGKEPYENSKVFFGIMIMPIVILLILLIVIINPFNIRKWLK